MLTEHIELPDGADYASTDYYNSSHWRVIVRVNRYPVGTWHSVTDGRKLTNDEASAVSRELNLRISIIKALAC